MRGSRRSRWSNRFLVLAAVLFAVGCGSGVDRPRDGEAIGEVGQTRDDLLLPVPSADVLGFETTSGWKIALGVPQPLSLTDTRTKGAHALAVSHPLGLVRLQSAFLDSGNAELAKIDRGTALAVDLMLPAQQINPFWFGSAQIFVTALSRGVIEANLGQVDLTKLRTGVYNTLRFKVPDAAADALRGATYADLTIGIVLNLPPGSLGTYRLDNLRVKNTTLPAAPTDVSGIQSGQSILLTAFKTYSPASSQVATSSFAQGVIQVPRSFHAVLGQAGTGTATFEYRLGANPISTCTYTGAATGAVDYALTSCSGGALAGDLVPADWVRLTVVNGDASAGQTKIKAQITLNPLDDEIVAGMPPVPTFFGQSAAEVSAALNAFVQEQQNWSITDNVLVKLPTPNVPPVDNVTVNGASLPPTRPGPNDPQFGLSGRLTGTDLADAGWHVSGSLSGNIDTNSGSRLLHFDVDAGVDAWLLGGHISNVADVNGTADSTTPPPSGNTIPPTTGTAQFCYSIFGVGSGCAGPFNEQAGIQSNLFSFNPSITFLSLSFYVFSVSASGDLNLGATASGGFTPSGIGLTLTPSASLSVELSGGLSVGSFLGGGLFGKGQLVGFSAPITASLDATFNPEPGVCSVTLSELLSGQAVISSGNGSFGYYIEGGLTCGFFSGLCWRDDETIFSWGGYNRTVDILPASPLANQVIPLDPAVCPATNLTGGVIAYPPPGSTFHQTDGSFLLGGETVTFGDPANGGVIVELTDFAWSSSDPSDTVNGSFIRYGNPGPRTISVVASKPNVATATDAETVNVLPNDPTTVPVPVIVAPTVNQVISGCDPFELSAIGTDPGGSPLTFTWYVNTDEPPNVVTPVVATGQDTSTAAIGTLVRVVATDAANHQGMLEIPIQHACTR